MTHVTCAIDNRVAKITLNYAPQNRIGEQMVGELAAAMADIANSDAPDPFSKIERSRG